MAKTPQMGATEADVYFYVEDEVVRDTLRLTQGKYCLSQEGGNTRE